MSKYISGGWSHIFDTQERPGTTNLTICFDTEQNKLVAMNIHLSYGSFPASKQEIEDVQDSLINANEDALECPEDYCLEVSSTPPAWALPQLIGATKESEKALPYLVSFKDAETGDDRTFECEAKDAVHAIEQVLSAYPGCVVLECQVRMFVIASLSEADHENVAAFWSNDHGWGCLSTASRFSSGDRHEMTLPFSRESDAYWVTIG